MIHDDVAQREKKLSRNQRKHVARVNWRKEKAKKTGEDDELMDHLIHENKTEKIDASEATPKVDGVPTADGTDMPRRKQGRRLTRSLMCKAYSMQGCDDEDCRDEQCPAKPTPVEEKQDDDHTNNAVVPHDK